VGAGAGVGIAPFNNAAHTDDCGGAPSVLTVDDVLAAFTSPSVLAAATRTILARHGRGTVVDATQLHSQQGTSSKKSTST
jgi:hypothetical protein